MEKITVQYLPEITGYLNELAVLLFQKNYFSTFESSVSYIEKLIDFIDHKINLYPKDVHLNIYWNWDQITYFTKQILRHPGIFFLKISKTDI